jgi:hypothetical protein
MCSRRISFFANVLPQAKHLLDRDEFPNLEDLFFLFRAPVGGGAMFTNKNWDCVMVVIAFWNARCFQS